MRTCCTSPLVKPNHAVLSFSPLACICSGIDYFWGNANRLMKPLGLIAAAGIGAGLIFLGAENIRGKSAWKNFKKEWEAKGEVFDYKQIIPKPIPSEKNFAHIPLLKPLHEHNWNKDLTKFKPVDQKNMIGHWAC